MQSVRRHYRGATLILENEFVTESGAVVVIDFMPVARRAQRTDIVRIVLGLRGTVLMRMDLTVRFDYGHIVPWITRYDHAIRAIAGPDALELKAPVPLHVRNFATVSEITIASGQTIPFALTWYPSHEAPLSEEDSGKLLRETEAWWLEWSSRCTLAGLAGAMAQIARTNPPRHLEHAFNRRRNAFASTTGATRLMPHS